MNKPDDERFEIYYEDLSDKKISRLISRLRSVSDGIKQVSFVPELATIVIEYYEDTVMKDLNPFRKNDVIHELVEVIKGDTVIGDKKQYRLQTHYKVR